MVTTVNFLGLRCFSVMPWATQGAEAAGPQLWGLPVLHSKFKSSLCNSVRLPQNKELRLQLSRWAHTRPWFNLQDPTNRKKENEKGISKYQSLLSIKWNVTYRVLVLHAHISLQKTFTYHFKKKIPLSPAVAQIFWPEGNSTHVLVLQREGCTWLKLKIKNDL